MFYVEGTYGDGGSIAMTVKDRQAACIMAQGIEEDGGSAHVYVSDTDEEINFWEGYQVHLAPTIGATGIPSVSLAFGPRLRSMVVTCDTK